MVKISTGVDGIICAAHEDECGKMHGHTWEVVAWFGAGDDAQVHKNSLSLALESLDHSVLPKHLCSGEALGAEILERLGERCYRVLISRPKEGIHAMAER